MLIGFYSSCFSQLNTYAFSKLYIGLDSRCQQHNISFNQASVSYNYTIVCYFFCSCISININSIFSQVPFNKYRHIPVNSLRDGGPCNQRHLHAKLPENFAHFKSYKSCSDYCCLFRGFTFDKCIYFIHMVDISQNEHIFSVRSLNIRNSSHGSCSNNKAVISVQKCFTCSKLLYIYCLLIGVYCQHLVFRKNIDIAFSLEKLRISWHQLIEIVKFFSYIVRHSTA